jgi:hypothetical protein
MQNKILSISCCCKGYCIMAFDINHRIHLQTMICDILTNNVSFTLSKPGLLHLKIVNMQIYMIIQLTNEI